VFSDGHQAGCQQAAPEPHRPTPALTRKSDDDLPDWEWSPGMGWQRTVTSDPTPRPADLLGDPTPGDGWYTLYTTARWKRRRF
jgi:hypothetical protein